jgi:hypothetical protein
MAVIYILTRGKWKDKHTRGLTFNACRTIKQTGQICVRKLILKLKKKVDKLERSYFGAYYMKFI